MSRQMNFTLTVEQAAQALKVSPQRVRVLLAKGRLQGYQDVSPGGRVTWCVHLSLHRRPGVAGRPRTKRRKAAMNGGSAAKP
jgi:excisionase family DNA binding protein